jgi:hypothetical protein
MKEMPPEEREAARAIYTWVEESIALVMQDVSSALDLLKDGDEFSAGVLVGGLLPKLAQIKAWAAARKSDLG